MRLNACRQPTPGLQVPAVLIPRRARYMRCEGQVVAGVVSTEHARDDHGVEARVQGIHGHVKLVRIGGQETCFDVGAINLGALLLKLGRLDEAEIYLKESLGEAPSFPKAHFQLGLLFEKKKFDAEAIRELKEAASCDPSYPEPYFVLGRIYRRKGDEKNAQMAYETFQRLSSARHAAR